MSDAIRISEHMREVINELRQLRVKRIHAQQAKEDREYDIHITEVYTLLDGLTPDGTLIRDTKPEAIREAWLRQALDRGKAYPKNRSDLHTAQYDAAMIDADIERAVNQLSALRAEARLLAAERAAVGE